MDIKTLAIDFYNCRGNLQQWINNRYKDLNSAVVLFRNYDYIVTKEGVKYRVTIDLETVDQVISDYRMDDITKDDVVLDIGATIGGFALRAARNAKGVYAFEPVRWRELQANILLNNVNNVNMVPMGLGDGLPVEIFWHEPITINTMPFHNIPPCNWLKADCEGAEWFIPAGGLRQFRRIEAELHWRGGGKKHWPVWKKVLDEYFEYELTKVPNANVIGILHARRK
jgi:hypothetical protein